MKTVIFDFDGTIADSLPAIYEVVNEVLATNKYPQIKKEEILNLREKSSIRILKESGIAFFRLPFMFIQGQKIFKKKVSTIKPIEGIVDVINNLKKEGYLIGIITSNSKESVEIFLEKYNFPKINFLYTGSLFGKEKAIKRGLREQKIDPRSVIYIGDEIRDIKACKKAGIRCIAVTWGFNSEESLKNEKPYYTVSKPEELPEIIKSATLN